MPVLADYEGLGVAFGGLLWIVATIPAALCALGGIVAGVLKHPRPRLAFWLGVVACLLELPAVALVQLAFLDEQSRIGAYADRFRPGAIFWGVSAMTTVLAVIALRLGVARRSTPGGRPTSPP